MSSTSTAAATEIQSAFKAVLKKLKLRRPKDGNVDEVAWRPVTDESKPSAQEFSLKLTAGGAIEFCGGSQIHTVGLAGTSFEPARDQRMFGREADLVAHIIHLVVDRYVMYGVKTSLVE